MLTKTAPDDRIVEYLQQNKLHNLNAAGFLQNNADAVAYIYGGDVGNGVIVASAAEDHFFFATENTAFIKEFLEGLTPGLKTFSGVPEHIAEIVVGLTGKPEWCNKCDVFVLTGEFNYVHDDRFARRSLTEADAKEVDEHYTYRGDWSLAAILDSIGKRESECLEIDGELAAWALTHDDNSIGPVYVKERYRGRRLAKVVVERLMEKLAAKNIIPYGHVVQSNDACHVHLTRVRGMTFSHVCWWFGVDKPSDL